MWRVPELVEEARRNVTARRSRLRLVAYVSILSGSILAAAVAAERHDVQTEVAGLAAEGWVTATFTADPGIAGVSGISSTACRALADVPGVAASGAISRPIERRVWQLGPSIPVAVVDTSLIRALRGSAHTTAPTAFLGSALAGSSPATVTVVGQRYRTVELPPPLNAAGLGNSVVLQGVATGHVAMCVAILSPAARLRPLNELAAQLHATAAPIVNSFVIDPPIRHPYARYLERPTRHLPIAAGLFLALLFAVSLRSRSSEFGAFLTAGTRRLELLVMTGSELVLLCSLHFASTSIAAFLLHKRLELESSLSWSYGATSAAVFLAAGGLASMLSTRRNVFELLKDR